MTGHKYTKEQKEFIAENCAGLTSVELTDLVNKTFNLNMKLSQIRSYKTNNKLRSGLKPCQAIKNRRELFSSEQKEFIANNCKGITTHQLTDLINLKFGLNIKQSQIRGYMKNHSLTNGINSQFKSGIAPINKGKKWDEFMSKEVQQKSRKTTYKKGNLPQNWVPVGSESITTDGYPVVKIEEPNKWALKHRLIYEQAYGPIPKNHAVLFLDGNKQNCILENLALVSQAELLILNRRKLISRESLITNVGITLSKVILATGKKKRIEKNASANSNSKRLKKGD